MTITEYVELNRSTGGFVCVSTAAGLAGVCRQRMWQLVSLGRVAVVNVLGQRLVTLASLQSWDQGGRKVGRPLRSGRLMLAVLPDQGGQDRPSTQIRAVKVGRVPGVGLPRAALPVGARVQKQTSAGRAPISRRVSVAAQAQGVVSKKRRVHVASQLSEGRIIKAPPRSVAARVLGGGSSVLDRCRELRRQIRITSGNQ